MFNADDIINYNNMPILGIVNKSNLSNEDFIVGFNDMLHWTQQDIVLNKITVFILNNDLTEPKLGPNSSIMLEITPNITTKK